MIYGWLIYNDLRVGMTREGWGWRVKTDGGIIE